jgi:hypothetical protein
MTATRELSRASKMNGSSQAARILKPGQDSGMGMPDVALWQGDVEAFLDTLPLEPIFDLVVTSPPYNLGKPYEKRSDLDEYLLWQSRIIDKIVPRLKSTGNLCWQVGNYVEDGEILPLDIEFAPIFRTQNCNSVTGSFGISATGCTQSGDSPGDTKW